MVPAPKAGDYILWREYGFQHVTKSETETYCGYNFTWRLNFARRHGDTSILVNSNPKNRPLCGTCRKLSEGKK